MLEQAMRCIYTEFQSMLGSQLHDDLSERESNPLMCRICKTRVTKFLSSKHSLGCSPLKIYKKERAKGLNRP